MVGGNHDEEEQSESRETSQNEGNLDFEIDTANGPEEEESKPLMCTTLNTNSSVDEAELIDEESEECIENVVNLPKNDSTTHPNAAENSVDDAYSNTEHAANQEDTGERDECERDMLRTKLIQSVSRI